MVLHFINVTCTGFSYCKCTACVVLVVYINHQNLFRNTTGIATDLPQFCVINAPVLYSDKTVGTSLGGGFGSFENKKVSISLKQMAEPVSVSKKFHSTNGQFPKPDRS